VGFQAGQMSIDESRPRRLDLGPLDLCLELR
jgi:hypothetical protein